MYTIAKDLSLCSVCVHCMQVFNLRRTDAEGSYEHELSGNKSIIHMNTLASVPALTYII